MRWALICYFHVCLYQYMGFGVLSVPMENGVTVLKPVAGVPRIEPDREPVATPRPRKRGSFVKGRQPKQRHESVIWKNVQVGIIL